MLNELLNLIREGKLRSVGGLARELDTTSGLVEAMMERLVTEGYMRRPDSGCDKQCGSCPAEAACATGDRGRVWSLAE